MLGKLRELGFTDGEIRVYTELLRLGSTTTGKIIEKAHITSSKVYVILDKLEKKGLVSHILINNVKHFQATDPKRLLDYIEKKKVNLDEIEVQIEAMLPELNQFRNSESDIQESTMYQGFKGLQSALYEVISDLVSEEEFLVFGAQGHFGKTNELFIKRFYKEKEERGIKTRLIYNAEFKDILSLYEGLSLTKIKFIDTITPSTIVIAKNKVLLISYGETSQQILIKNNDLAQSFAQFFKSMWSIAKE